MRDITKNIQPLTTLRSRSGEFLKQLREEQASGVADRQGNAATIAQNAAAWQPLLDIAAQADAREEIRQGLDDLKESRLRPAREFFTEFETRRGLAP